MSRASVPDQAQLLWPTVQAVRTLGGSGSIDEIVATVLEQQDFTEEQQQVLHGDGPRTEIEYRLAWARTYLKYMNLLVNSRRGVWALTERGRSVHREEVPGLHAEVVARQREELRAKRRAQQSKGMPAEAEQQIDDEQDWREQLLDVLMSVSPAAFERLAQRLLREAGFISTTVTGRTGDGGIDGLGIYRMSLVSFPVFFQSKRYRGSVGSSAVRDFRGAMAGRGDKGLLITTGTFTVEAKAEATRDGAPPVDLIDGRRLCDLLKEYELGVLTETRIVEDVRVEKGFFADL
ncbi:restriction endonuclease [Micromonospora sp. NBC_00362]|uniref:restriction endonuclease n=1 Tax=Micromonospora sp. NBC_00362 TaxID=2975975 RepID=UPI00225AE9AE|nr:restriction endonuclease [Micromonospora sp. NBC_00362]MCX5118572.1 restriction endonuclease [Micromonospora sp. NBC_00362]